MPTIVMTRTRTVLGQFCCTRQNGLLSVFSRPKDCTIKISLFYDMTEHERLSVLLHEMIHYYIAYNRIKDTSPHGEVFRSLMRQLNSQGWSVSVSGKTTKLNVSARASTSKWRIVLALETAEHKRFLSVVQKNYVSPLDSQIKGIPEIVNHAWFLSDDDYFHNFPTVRTLRGRRVVKEEFERLTSSMKKLEI